MTIDALRSRIQPVLQQDFDAVREEFSAESGTDDPRAFVRHLREWELIPVDLANSLLLELAVEESQETSTADADDEATLLDVDPDDEATEMHEEGPPAAPPPDAQVQRADEEATQMAQEDAPPAAPQLLVTDPASTEHDRSSPQDTAQSEPAGDSGAQEVEPSAPEGEQESEEFDPEGDTVQLDPERLDPEAMRRAALARTPGLASQRPPISPPVDASGRYEVLQGTPREDALGLDFLARDKVLGRLVFWRVPQRDPALRAAFAREIRVWIQLDQPGVPAVHEDRGEEGCIVQRAEGASLKGVLDEARLAIGAGRAVPPEAELVPLLQRLAEVCEIVGRAHARGVAHSDLGPQHVRLLSRGGALVVGWSQAGTLPGASVSLPPREGAGAADARDDVLRLGEMLREAWTLHPAAEGTASPPGRQALPALEALIQRATSPDRSARPSDASELALQLRRSLQGEGAARAASPATPRPAQPAAPQLRPGLLEPVGQLLARYPGPVLGAGVALIFLWLLTAVLGILW